MLALSGGCAGGSAPPPAARAEVPVPTASPDDALEGTPALALVLRPRALVRDALYGPLLQRAAALAAGRARVSGVGTTALAVLERADEVAVLAYDEPAAAGAVNALLLVRGVPADVDPARVIDADGQPVWRPVRTEGAVTELEPAVTTADTEAALFVLPHRAWVIALGAAIARARGVYFQRDAPRPHDDLPRADEGAHVQVRLSGEALVRREVRLQEGPLSPLGHSLESVTLTLLPYKGVHDDAWRASLAYGAPEAAAAAEGCLREILEAFKRAKAERQRWLSEILVTRVTSPEPSRVVNVHGSLPRGWVEGLLEAGGAPLGDASLGAP